MNWPQVLAVLASTFHFPASELWDMGLDDLSFWLKQAEWTRGSQG